MIKLFANPFPTRCSVKAQAKKVLEEAAELFNEVEMVRKHPELDYNLVWLEDEAADVITAALNLVWCMWRTQFEDFSEAELQATMRDAMERCAQRNKTRGRIRMDAVRGMYGDSPTL